MFSTLLALSLVAPPKPFPLTVESIMRGYALVGHPPHNLRWSADGTRLRFSWAKADGKADPTPSEYQVNADGLGLSAATPEPDVERAMRGADHVGSHYAYESGGDIFVFDSDSKKTRRITKTNDYESNPVVLEDGKAVGYLRGGNYYCFDLESGETDQLTDVRKAPPAGPPATLPTSSQAALESESKELFKSDPGGPQRRGRRPRNGGGREGSATPITIPEGYEAGQMTLAPSGAFASIELSKPPQGDRIAQVPNFMARSGYTEMIPTYEKVGDPQGSGKVLIVNLNKGTTTEVSAPRDAFVWSAKWSKDGAHALVQLASLDHKDTWLLGFDTKTGKVASLWDEHDDAWVGGPGAGIADYLPDGSRIYFVTEKSGFSQLMSMQWDGTDVRPITAGNFEVSNVMVDADHSRFLFVSSEGSPFRRHLDALPLSGGVPTKIADLSADDDSTYAIAPNGKDVAVVRSSANRPPELYVNGTQVTHTPTEEWLSGPWIVPPIVKVPSRDGVEIPAHLYKPANWRKGGPAVVFVHGAGYLQNVYEGWSYYYREYMFHHVLMSLGYAVLDMDYRASAGYGRAWRTAIYRHMGGKDLDDNVDGARWLVSQLGADPKRLGIYGGSYGGFITLMAMFKTPDVFAAGAALRPVSDWANYNHGYTSAILNLPQDDREAYRQSSPIYFAEGLKGSLLICHGMVDTNVHFQDSVRLVERLIELGKTDFQVAPYPVEDHAFRKPSSWADEYRRILELFERTIGKGFKDRTRKSSGT